MAPGVRTTSRLETVLHPERVSAQPRKLHGKGKQHRDRKKLSGGRDPEQGMCRYRLLYFSLNVITGSEIETDLPSISRYGFIILIGRKDKSPCPEILQDTSAGRVGMHDQKNLIEPILDESVKVFSHCQAVLRCFWRCFSPDRIPPSAARKPRGCPGLCSSV